MIDSAVLLAAGFGKRQRPFTDQTPKPLLAVNGRPTLDFVLRAVQHAGIRRVCLVTHHLESQIMEYVGDGSTWRLEATFAHQNELRGSGDALLSVPADWMCGQPVMVAATDYLLEENALLELVQAHAQRQADITMSLKECPTEELIARSSVEVDENWQVKRIIEKPSKTEILSPFAASLLFILPSQTWDYLALARPSRQGEIEVQTAIQKMLQDGYKAFGVLQPAPAEWNSAVHMPARNDVVVLEAE